MWCRLRRQVWSLKMRSFLFIYFLWILHYFCTSSHLTDFNQLGIWLACHQMASNSEAAEKSSWTEAMTHSLHAPNTAHNFVNGFDWLWMVTILILTNDPMVVLCILSDLGVHRASGSLITQNPPQRLRAFAKPSRLSDGGLQLVRLRLTQNPHPGWWLWWAHT